MHRMPSIDPAGDEPLQRRGGRPSARPDAVSPERPRGRRRFRYRLLDPAGTHVKLIERDHALRPDDILVVPLPVGDVTWRVVAVLGSCATVSRSNSARYQIHVSAGEASAGSRHFLSHERYAVGDEITLGGELWRIGHIDQAEDADGPLTRLLCVPAGR
jgi:hypothetical protein